VRLERILKGKKKKKDRRGEAEVCPRGQSARRVNQIRGQNDEGKLTI